MSSFNTQPPEGGWHIANTFGHSQSSFNTQPPEGGWIFGIKGVFVKIGFNTQPPEGGWCVAYQKSENGETFQHTAARRRLGMMCFLIQYTALVSTHSRPKAAG